jgi:hypothetical protein
MDILQEKQQRLLNRADTLQAIVEGQSLADTPHAETFDANLVELKNVSEGYCVAKFFLKIFLQCGCITPEKKHYI